MGILKKILVALVVCSCCAAPAFAYIWIPFGLGGIIKLSTEITVLEVEKVSKEKGAIIFKRIADLKGTLPEERLRQSVSGNSFILSWAEPGKRAIHFTDGSKRAHMCIGNYWYSCSQGKDDWWFLSRGEPEFGWCYYGSVDQLREHVKDILAGKEVVVTAVQYEGYRKAVGFEEALKIKRPPLWRIKVSLKQRDYPFDLRGFPADPRIVGLGGSGPDRIPQLLEALNDPDRRRRAEAADDLGELGAQARQAVGGLREAAKDGDPWVRLSASGALLRVDPSDRSTIAALLAALRGGDAPLRIEAVDILGRAGAAAKEATPALIGLLESQNVELRRAAAAALMKMGEATEHIVPVFLQMLKDPDYLIRRDAAMRTPSLDVATVKKIAASLAEALKDSDLMVVDKAAESLMRLGPEAGVIVPVIVAGFEKKEISIHRPSIDLLAVIGPGAKEAVPVLIELSATRTGWDRGRVVRALGLIGPDARAALPCLQGLASDPDAYVRDQAAKALKSIQK